MKKTLTALFTCIVIVSSTGAIAGGYGGYHGGYHGGHHGGYYGGGYYGLHAGYYGSDGDVLGFIVGGLLLGSILHYAFSDPGYTRHYPEYPEYRQSYTTYRAAEPVRHYRVYEEPVYREVITRRTIRYNRVSSQRTHLHRDRHGNCFEVSYDRDGRELREELSRNDCNW